MKQFAMLALVAAFILAPLAASAHEVQVFEIGGEEYQFVVGSLNEPIVVDDKTGVELQVSMVGHEAMPANDHHGAGGAVIGLEETLQVELIAGAEKKVLDLSPIYGEAGSYKAPFYPTVATTLSYRFFGTVNNTPVDLTFTCATTGHGDAEEKTEAVVVSDGVTRISKTGAFGCPAPKEGMGFPEESATVRSLASQGGMGTAALGLSIAALLLAGYVVGRKN